MCLMIGFSTQERTSSVSLSLSFPSLLVFPRSLSNYKFYTAQLSLSGCFSSLLILSLFNHYLSSVSQKTQKGLWRTKFSNRLKGSVGGIKDVWQIGTMQTLIALVSNTCFWCFYLFVLGLPTVVKVWGHIFKRYISFQ